jgi:bacillithiol system protein YtxJ
MQWHKLESLEDLSFALEKSNVVPVALFKHSTRCSISSAAKDRIERQWTFSESQLPIYYLDLIQFREISNKIAEVTGVTHESPQLIIVKNGKAVYDTSHSGIIPRLIPEEILS